jgi:uncharacterized protein (UPF0333 family)
MRKSVFIKRGQTALEYAVVIICVVGALIAMREYMTRSIQGRMRAVADDIGPQYAPDDTSGDVTITYNHQSDTTVNTTDLDGLINTTTNTTFDETTTIDADETIGP